MRSYKGKGYKPRWDDWAVFVGMHSVADIAKQTNYSVRTVRQWCEEGRVVAWNIGKQWIVYLPSVEKFLQRRDSS